MHSSFLSEHQWSLGCSRLTKGTLTQPILTESRFVIGQTWPWLLLNILLNVQNIHHFLFILTFLSDKCAKQKTRLGQDAELTCAQSVLSKTLHWLVLSTASNELDYKFKYR